MWIRLKSPTTRKRFSDEVKVVAAVALGTVIEDYEAAFKEAGFNPGVVLPSTLAALGAAEARSRRW